MDMVLMKEKELVITGARWAKEIHPEGPRPVIDMKISFLVNSAKITRWMRINSKLKYYKVAGINWNHWRFVFSDKMPNSSFLNHFPKGEKFTFHVDEEKGTAIILHN